MNQRATASAKSVQCPPCRFLPVDGKRQAVPPSSPAWCRGHALAEPPLSLKSSHAYPRGFLWARGIAGSAPPNAALVVCLGPVCDPGGPAANRFSSPRVPPQPGAGATARPSGNCEATTFQRLAHMADCPSAGFLQPSAAVWARRAVESPKQRRRIVQRAAQHPE